MTDKPLVDRLNEAGQAHKGTELGGLLQWAALHIESQKEAIEQWEIDFEEEHAERLRLEAAIHEASAGIDSLVERLSKFPLI